VNRRHLRAEDLRGLRWAGYLRESTQRQADRGTPLQRQREDIQRAADELGLVGPVTWFEQTGSGEKESEALGAALVAGTYDVLMVYSTSRFARDRVNAGNAKRAFAKAGIAIYFVSERLLSGTRETNLTEGIREVLDEEDNNTRRHFIAGGVRERQLSGKWVGRVPFGLRRHMADNPDGSRSWDGTLEPDPALADLVQIILTGKQPEDPHLTARFCRDLRANPIYRGQMVRYRRSTSAHYFDESDPRDGRQIIAASWVG
jgi:site-specific DNA recombinase